MNARSSRSHTILTIWLEIVRADGKINSKLNLVDLAGSERRDHIGENASDTLKREGVQINLSLSSLRLAVQELAKRRKPAWGNSPLTKYMQDSIGSNCKTTCIVCIYADAKYANETLSTCECVLQLSRLCYMSGLHEWPTCKVVCLLSYLMCSCCYSLYASLRWTPL